ncbi:aminopeptidase N isoform X1 [Maniola jurtina]|uniref:aminopeptidase N isoform X1 n=1 Tax=Maniola jurtina TaxID=191418 RepID=UPI001E68F87D|nr:aminopeptidase N isoform X1 [Maniola jurtina]XP_045766152.1 aminopeptidase N isoform X1 [Maniola jurtina]
MNALQLCLLASLCICSHSLPPDKMKPFHIIKTRSIDLNNARGLVMETRLEKSVEPTGYRLELEPYLEDALYKGHVSINVTWLEDSNTISVHCAHEVEITESEVKAYLPSDAKKPQKIPIKKTSMDPRKPIFTLRLEKLVPKNSVGYINFSFKASMQTANTEAFFKTTYVDEQDVERMVAATQLRPNNARRMFPCFDEPGYKTPFELSVVRPRTMIALSNTPVARTEDINGEPNAVWDHFERTPPMSTFTLGLIIADLKQLGESIHYKDDNGNDIELRVWGRSEYLQALEGVNEKLSRVFGEVAKFWQVSLPLRRLDIVALPNYQGVKPADNWGLIVYKESDLCNNGYLYLAHEISYQWLGALVTPAWWSDAHLNKAFVGYLAAEIAFKLDGGSEMDGKWPMTMLYSLYYEFSKRYPHSRITGMKQETACFKIELLFRMFNYTIGEDTFKKGIRTFIESKKFKTFTGDDIWNALNEAALADGKIPKDVDIKTVAASWIDKERLPLITVKRNTDANSALVSQKVYLRERPHDVPDAAKLLWWAPIVLWRSDNLDFTNTMPVTWMRNHKDLNLVNMPDKEHFIIVNPEEIAPFPVNYDDENWKLISEFLQSEDSTKIPELTRAKLLHDAWNLAYAGELSFATALNMTLFLPKEKHPLVWDPVFTMIDHVGRHICTSLQDKFRAYVRNLLAPLYNELGKDASDKEHKWKKSLRSNARYFLCSTGYKPCVQEAQEQFSKWMQAPNPDEGNPVSDSYLCPVFRWGTQQEWDFALQRVIKFPPSRTKSERTYLLKTLAGCPYDEHKIEKILNITLLEENGNFTESDLLLIFSMLTGSPQGTSALFHFLANNWELLKERYSSRTNVWDSLISCATSRFTTQEGYDLVSNFYVEHKGEFSSAQHIMEKALRNILEETKWSADNIPVLERWLDNYLQNTEMEEDQYEKN